MNFGRSSLISCLLEMREKPKEAVFAHLRQTENKHWPIQLTFLSALATVLSTYSNRDSAFIYLALGYQIPGMYALTLLSVLVI